MNIEDALAELGGLVRCRCSPAYKNRGLQDPDCDCDSADAVAVLRQLALDYIAAEGQAAEACQSWLAAEAKLAKAVEKARADERERCAKVARAWGAQFEPHGHPAMGEDSVKVSAACAIASAIHKAVEDVK